MGQQAQKGNNEQHQAHSTGHSNTPTARRPRLAPNHRRPTVAIADITADLWRKLAFISTMSAACGLARSPVGLS